MPNTGSLATLSAPTLIRPDNGAVYRLGGHSYRLMNGTTVCVAHLVNFGTSPATVSGTIAGVAGALVVEAREGVVIGWDLGATTWRALRMVGIRVVDAEDVPPDVQIGPLADATLWVEALDGTAAQMTPPAIAAYLSGVLPALPGLQSSPAWSV